jgi:hypothetical protein
MLESFIARNPEDPGQYLVSEGKLAPMIAAALIKSPDILQLLIEVGIDTSYLSCTGVGVQRGKPILFYVFDAPPFSNPTVTLTRMCDTLALLLLNGADPTLLEYDRDVQGGIGTGTTILMKAVHSSVNISDLEFSFLISEILDYIMKKCTLDVRRE